jgi:hypothetical protein
LVRAVGDDLARSHPLTPEQHRVLRDIARCRTAALGGHLEVCPRCAWEHPAFDSCGNRHCAKCQAFAAQRWLDRGLDRLPAIHYFHVVFTLPHELHSICRQHPAELYALGFEAASAALLELGRDPQRLGAQLGITAVLHTWTRKLHYHPHLHCVVTGGGLSLDQDRWLSTPPDFLFPVRVAAALFRGKVLAALRDRLSPVLRDQLYRRRWVVYCKPPFGGPDRVFEYLGRYTHRVGISNRRLLRIEDDTVTFATKHGQTETCSRVEFLRRVVQHVLPRQFVRIRHYGLLASRNVPTRLRRAQHCLQTAGAVIPRRLRRRARDWHAWYHSITGIDLRACPRCKYPGLERRPLAAARAPPQPEGS